MSPNYEPCAECHKKMPVRFLGHCAPCGQNVHFPKCAIDHWAVNPKCFKHYRPAVEKAIAGLFKEKP